MTQLTPRRDGPDCLEYLQASINPILTRAGAVVPEPARCPKSSYICFEAAQPNECWQADFTTTDSAAPTAHPAPMRRS